MSLYSGIRNFTEKSNKRGICTVINGRNQPVNSLIDLGAGRQHFDWGIEGRLSANLARSLLVDYFKKDSDDIYFNEVVRRFYQDVICNLEFTEWTLEDEQLKQYLTRVVKEVYGEELYT